ncbi:hypothetical protein [Loigolactobacillus binensis]|uniref:Uncharacterized protein n=1 Tax=Loigolactobacillus binensis TaxID=2559922 RepID=A0ABW3EHJ8_9LACO|nr:hypothetical protein [Loigolactobacillus binensis]
MFNTMFWILAVWFVINVIWMWFQLDNHALQKIFAWINVIAVIVGFWVFYGASHASGSIATCFLWMNWANVIVACLQFYFGYRKNN